MYWRVLRVILSHSFYFSHGFDFGQWFWAHGFELAHCIFHCIEEAP
jgi:hypothetical protein